MKLPIRNIKNIEKKNYIWGRKYENGCKQLVKIIISKRKASDKIPNKLLLTWQYDIYKPLLASIDLDLLFKRLSAGSSKSLRDEWEPSEPREVFLLCTKPKHKTMKQ